MSDPLEDVAPGDPPPLRADTFNLVFEATRAYRDRRRGAGGAAALEHDPVTGNVLVWVRNDAGSTKAAFSVLQLGQPVIDVTDATGEPHKFRHNPVFPGTAPTGPDVAFAVTVEPLASGDIGRAVLLGVCVCDLSVTDAAHAYAAPAASTTATLASAVEGPAKVIWKASGTGTKRAVVLIEGASRAGFFARLTTASGGLWKWYRLAADLGSGGYVDSGSESATYNALPAKVDGSALLNPVAGLRVWMAPSAANAGYFEFLPVGYATTGFGGLISNASQHIPAPKIFDDYVTVNDAKTPTSASGLGTGEKVPFLARSAQLGGDAVTALQVVDSYASNTLSGRAVYAFREVWEGAATEAVLHSLYCGGAVFGRGKSSAFLSAGFDLTNTFPVYTSSGGLVAATAYAHPRPAEYVQWNVIDGQYLGVNTTGYTAFGVAAGLTHYLAAPGGSPAATDIYSSLLFGIKGKKAVAGLDTVYQVIDSSAGYSRVATTQGFAIAAASGNLVDGVDGTTPGGDTVQGGIVTAIGTAPRIPNPPAVNGTYTLQCVVSGGGTVFTYSWV